jgi:hypothetical protein
MKRRVLIAMAAAAMMCFSSAAFAGGGGVKTQYVRVKNVGATTVRVLASNSTLTPTSGGSRLLSQNAVTQFVLKRLPGQFGVGNNAGTAGDILNYNFPNSTFVYLQAKEVAGVYKASFAPPGTRF